MRSPRCRFSRVESVATSGAFPVASVNAGWTHGHRAATEHRKAVAKRTDNEPALTWARMTERLLSVVCVTSLRRSSSAKSGLRSRYFDRARTT